MRSGNYEKSIRSVPVTIPMTNILFWQVPSYCDSLPDEVQGVETRPELPVGKREEAFCRID